MFKGDAGLLLLNVRLGILPAEGIRSICCCEEKYLSCDFLGVAS